MNNFENTETIIKIVLLIVGSIWALYRFFYENPWRPRLEFDFDCAFMGPQQGKYLAAFIVFVRNRGTIEHLTNEIRITIRGIKHDEPLEYFKRKVKEQNEPETLKWANFPHPIMNEFNIIERRKLSKGNENGIEIFEDKKEVTFFVSSGVSQNFNFVTAIGEEYRFILVKCSFKYDNWFSRQIKKLRLKKKDLIHTAERVFEVIEKK